ncbi:hypothetical protein B0H16DRAFT_742222 [Mycena metata]|uniref:Uncharacterized protein n=1 Tax=Mycena metata TaxID=1033252 RepID=A0AAD7GRA6_9AGAR|nr:hypothetical protein B0H16DRAFT_742222 [Mycena metata]
MNRRSSGSVSPSLDDARAALAEEEPARTRVDPPVPPAVTPPIISRCFFAISSHAGMSSSTRFCWAGNACAEAEGTRNPESENCEGSRCWRSANAANAEAAIRCTSVGCIADSTAAASCFPTSVASGLEASSRPVVPWNRTRGRRGGTSSSVSTSWVSATREASTDLKLTYGRLEVVHGSNTSAVGSSKNPSASDGKEGSGGSTGGLSTTIRTSGGVWSPSAIGGVDVEGEGDENENEDSASNEQGSSGRAFEKFGWGG